MYPVKKTAVSNLKNFPLLIEEKINMVTITWSALTMKGVSFIFFSLMILLESGCHAMREKEILIINNPSYVQYIFTLTASTSYITSPLKRVEES